MKNKFYKYALGVDNIYYLNVFEKLDDGYFYKACWNWEAFFLGPFWYLNRRFSKVSIANRVFLFFVSVFIINDSILYPVNCSFIFLMYCFIFPVMANILYRYNILKYIDKNSDHEDQVLKVMLREKFKTEIERSNELRGK